MNRPLMLIALLLVVMAGVFMIASFGGEIALYLIVVSLIMTIVGVLTGK